jgi:hypothetical protein
VLHFLENFHDVVLVNFFELVGFFDSDLLVDIEDHGSFRVDFLEDRDLFLYGLEAKLSVLKNKHSLSQLNILDLFQAVNYILCVLFLECPLDDLRNVHVAPISILEFLVLASLQSKGAVPGP